MKVLDRVMAAGVVAAVVDVQAGASPATAGEEEPDFRRGDANNDGRVSIADAVRLLGFFMLGGSGPDCRRAGDVNGDDVLDIADPIYLLRFLFEGTSAPPAPYPDCGPEPGGESRHPCDVTPVCGEPVPEDSLGCARRSSCEV